MCVCVCPVLSLLQGTGSNLHFWIYRGYTFLKNPKSFTASQAMWGACDRGWPRPAELSTWTTLRHSLPQKQQPWGARPTSDRSRKRQAGAVREASSGDLPT